MFDFIKIQYRLGNFDDATLAELVERGHITSEQAQEIKNA